MLERQPLETWLCARSLSRGLPPPVPDSGGFASKPVWKRKCGVTHGYFLNLATDGNAIVACILTRDRAIAASGRAVRHDGIFVYDQIETAIGHRRRGLARAVMQALESEGRRASDRQFLSATEDGFALYATLGWKRLSPDSTAVIPSAAQ